MFAHTNVSCFEYSKDFAALRTITKKFIAQEATLKAAVTNTQLDSLEQKKYMLFLQLNQGIKNTIQVFDVNTRNATTSHKASFCCELFSSIIKTLCYDEQLKAYSSDLLIYHLTLLNTPRNYTKSVVHYSAVVGLTLLAAPSGVGAIAAVASVSHVGLRVSEGILSFNATNSTKLINELISELNRLLNKYNSDLKFEVILAQLGLTLNQLRPQQP